MSNHPRFNTSQIRHAFDAHAHHYDEYAGLQHEVSYECLEIIKEEWHKNAHILDLGAGTAMFAQNVKEQQLPWQVTGADLALGMCRVAAQGGVTMVNAEAEYLPFADGVFDGVFSSLMMQWVNYPQRVFREMVRVCKPGSRSIVSTFTYGTLDELKTSFEALDKRPHVNQFGPPNYFSALAAHAGFQVVGLEENIYSEYYPDLLTLLRCLKAIGATTKEQEYGKEQEFIRPRVMTPRQLKQVEAAYRREFAHENGLPVTWQVMIMLLEKP